MSVYSGFAKRNQETIYNKLVYKSLEVLSDYIYNSKFSDK